MEKKPDFWTLIGIRCTLIGILFVLYLGAYIFMATPGHPQKADIHKDGLIVTTNFPADYPGWSLYPLDPAPVFAPLHAIDRRLRPGIWTRVEHRPAPTPFVGPDNRSTNAPVILRRLRAFAIDKGDSEMQGRLENALSELESGPAKADRRLLAAFVETEPNRRGIRKSLLVFFDDEASPIQLHFMNGAGQVVGSAEVTEPVVTILSHPYRWIYLDIKIVDGEGESPLSILKGESWSEHVALIGQPETVVCANGDSESVRVYKFEEWPLTWSRSR